MSEPKEITVEEMVEWINDAWAFIYRKQVNVDEAVLQAIRKHLEKQTVDIKRLAHLLFISIPPGALTCPYDFLTKRFESRLRTELGVRIEP